ncbi:MAG: PEGA domain-containing protein, partial [Myxococcota bacterium]|nr:PEGA domain-containing protein [Myxococcota bacterium]
GFDALADREHGAAETLFQGAFDVLSRHTGQLDRRLMARTLKGLGVARAMAGQVGPAQEMMGASLNMWPDQQPAEYAYSRDVLATFKGTQRKQMNQSTGNIMVATNPEGAEVSVDGVVVGVGPVSVPELAAGRHWVSVAEDGYVRSAAFVDVAPGESLGHRVVLEERPNREAWDTVIDKMPKAFRSKRTAKGVMPALVSILEADEVIVLQLDKRGGYKLKGWHQSADGLAPAKLTLARDASFITNLNGFVDGTLNATVDENEQGILDAPPADTTVMEVGGDPTDELFIDPNDPILKTKKKRRGRSITKEWWFWTAIGGTAAALTVGAIVLFSQQDEGKGPVGDLVINFNRVGGD